MVTGRTPGRSLAVRGRDRVSARVVPVCLEGAPPRRLGPQDVYAKVPFFKTRFRNQTRRTAHARRGKYGFRRVIIDNRSHVASLTMEETLNVQ
jgi:hypothetical protein